MTESKETRKLTQKELWEKLNANLRAINRAMDEAVKTLRKKGLL